MSDISDLEKILQEDEVTKKPSNFGLQLALFAYNLIAITIDIASAILVSLVTQFWLYGVLVLFSGAAPLIVHEILWVRPYASKYQRDVAKAGIIAAVTSVIIVAIAAGVAYGIKLNQNVSPIWLDVGMIVFIILVMAVHGLLCAIYYFSDEEIIANSATHRAIARSQRKITTVTAAGRVIRAGNLALDKTRLLHERIGDKGAVEHALKLVRGEGEEAGPVDTSILPTFTPTRPKISFRNNGSSGAGEDTEFPSPR